MRWPTAISRISRNRLQSDSRDKSKGDMSRKFALPDPSRIADDTLIRLGVAAALEFPDGSMSASGLRSEARRGHLKIWRIAGKDFTTKQALMEMRTQCAQPNHRD